ncbi:AMP-binding protein [Mariprofundus ferrooxydans]|uniref:Long-chain acyl-CoA synthetases (AMP-forming) n=1 Tax=Mariprofundus ferrooxydans PV-1 TaxID=314345 RepID=Q0F2B6_9PROT|nr:AMP-binding protein [Mariprofundus ferrooxydans]EAU55634.1 Long-chain acyl-CoA synthetases (AMP-forming) [Mariprofundus ferrooxydans PV-1]KON48635.1 long-chain acyl-CoA synthetase [Mariprofundus ferrooxydans]
MSRVLAALHTQANDRPEHVALTSASISYSYSELRDVVDSAASLLRDTDMHTLALAADNSPAWLCADLACMQAAIPLIPVPHFFAPTQIGHLLHHAGVDGILTDRADQFSALLAQLGIPSEATVTTIAGLSLIRISTADVRLPADCAKITYTSGSTGEPKGVCLSLDAMETVAASLAAATGAGAEDRHLALLPYATLLENIGGVYAPLLAGATIHAPGMAAIGMSGASGLDVKQFVSALHAARATTCIMIPQMLHALVAAVGGGMAKPESLRYIAVGGAPVSLKLLETAAHLELPVYEGYGLSEAASVVAVNAPGVNRPGSVGKPLPHVTLSFADDGEILVRGSLFSGYLGESQMASGAAWPTGDIGYLDDDGFLHLSGRKKHIFITAFGRNVSPEWVERELSIEPAIGQSCIFGEARPFNVAVIVPRQNFDMAAVDAAVASANARLPDYARISRWVEAGEPFSVANGLWTGTGRPRRQHIETHYRQQLDTIYEES